MKKHLALFIAAFLFFPSVLLAAGNERVGSYDEAKRLFDDVYCGHRITVYCGFTYDGQRNIDLPDGFIIASHPSRASRMEREHVVPAENFGRAFREWREGSPLCIDSKGNPFKGRRCAELASERFRLMEADLHNLFPSVGCVNAARRNFNFEELGTASQPFGPTCPMKFEGRKVEPPARAKGAVARAYLYMDDAYGEYRMSRQQKRLMETWDSMYPPDAWECERNRRIRRAQGNGNPFVERKCE